MLKAEIVGEDLVLRRLELIHLNQEYLDTLNDLEHMKWSRHRSEVHTFTTSANFIEGLRAEGNEILGIFKKMTGELLGTISLRKRTLSEVSLSFMVLRNFAGQGVMTRALEYLISFLLQDREFETLYIGTNSRNFPMRKLAERSGFINTTCRIEGSDIFCEYTRDIR
jgi:RimJ/RimL family protein N-acetyltransferase